MKMAALTIPFLVAVAAVVHFDQTTWATPLLGAIVVVAFVPAIVGLAGARDKDLTPAGRRNRDYLLGTMLLVTLVIVGAIAWKWAAG